MSFCAFVGRSVAFAVRGEYDIIFASSGPLTVAVPGIIASLRHRSRFVFEVRDVWPKMPIALGEIRNPVAIALAKGLEKAAYLRAHQVIALSPGMAKDVRSVNHQVSVSVVPNASDVSEFRNYPLDKNAARQTLGWEPDTTYLTFVGSLGRTYDIGWLVALAGALCRREEIRIKVKIYGEGSSLVKGREMAQSLGLDPLDLLPGAVPKSSVPSILRASDLAASVLANNPALEVNSLNKVFDAFAAQRPLVFNHGGWLAELAETSGAGWILGRDAQLAADELIGLVMTHDLAEASRASGALADRCFSRDLLYQDFRVALLGEQSEATASQPFNAQGKA